MKQETLTKALAHIEEKHKIASFDYDNLTKKLRQDKKFVELEKAYTTEKIENARKLAYNEKTDRTKEKELKAQIDSYYKDTKPNYNCKLCHDTGYVNSLMCKCLKEEISKILYEESNFGKLIDFDKAKKSADQNLLPVYELMEKWCQSDFKKNLVFISGKVGVGKTYLTRAIAHRLILDGRMIKLASAFEMSKDFNDYRYNYDDYSLDKYLECEFLFIDDLGTEIIYKNSTLELLYLTINERKTKNLCTIITSNLGLDEIMDRYGERTFSRIIDKETSICLNLDGEDKRTKRKQKF